MSSITRIAKLAVLAFIALGVISMWAYETYGTRYVQEGNVTNGIEGATTATLKIGGTTYPLYFEGGAGEVLQKMIADDLTVIFGHVKTISVNERASRHTTTDELALPITHWIGFPAKDVIEPPVVREEFPRIVTYEGRHYLLVTKDLITAYRAAWLQKQRYSEAYEKLDKFVSSLNDLAQGRLTVDKLPRSVTDMHYLGELSEEGLKELQSPQSVQDFERSFQQMTLVIMPSILHVFEKEYYREAYDSNGWEDIPLPGKLYTELFYIEDGQPQSSLWLLMYVGGEWKIYFIESLLGVF